MKSPTILITNDDGIESPGLAAVIGALDGVGDLLIVAPSVQQTSMGRARTQDDLRNGRIYKQTIKIGAKTWPAFAANATPALTVEHALQELASRPVDLVISGINYGENVGTCVTVSGTIGAALEAAEHKIPAIAVSLELPIADYHNYDQTTDFTAAAFFVRYFSERVLKKEMPFDVDLLKIEIPQSATEETPWVVTHQDRFVYYQTKIEERMDPFADAAKFNHIPQKGKFGEEGTDAHALALGLVSVTPISLDMTSRVAMADISAWLRNGK